MFRFQPEVIGVPVTCVGSCIGVSEPNAGIPTIKDDFRVIKVIENREYGFKDIESSCQINYDIKSGFLLPYEIRIDAGSDKTPEKIAFSLSNQNLHFPNSTRSMNPPTE